LDPLCPVSLSPATGEFVHQHAGPRPQGAIVLLGGSASGAADRPCLPLSLTKPILTSLR
jgi:hypothetical protein